MAAEHQIAVPFRDFRTDQVGVVGQRREHPRPFVLGFLRDDDVGRQFRDDIGEARRRRIVEQDIGGKDAQVRSIGGRRGRDPADDKRKDVQCKQRRDERCRPSSARAAARAARASSVASASCGRTNVTMSPIHRWPAMAASAVSSAANERRRPDHPCPGTTGKPRHQPVHAFPAPCATSHAAPYH